MVVSGLIKNLQIIELSTTLFKIRITFFFFLYYQLVGPILTLVLYLNEPTQTEIFIQSPITLQTYSKSDDITWWWKWNRRLKIDIRILTFFPIITLIMGQLDKNQCPINSWIPLWMTFFGALIFIVSIHFFTFSLFSSPSCYISWWSLITILCCSDDDRDTGYGIGSC